MAHTAPLACRIEGRNGRTLHTDAYTDHPAGAARIEVRGPDGSLLGTWRPGTWATADEAAAEVRDLLTQLGAVTVRGEEYGQELSWTVAGGELRGCPSGSCLRLLDAYGQAVDGGSAYWVLDEYVEEPELVLGAVLGGLRSLT